MSQQPIGVFDSGIGGLSTLKAIRRHLPDEDFIYVADLAWSPYGNRDAETLRGRGEQLCRFLVSHRCKAIVIACNTATAAAAAHLRALWSLPIIGVEPGIKPATAGKPGGVIAVLATERTLASDKFRLLLQQFSAQATVIPQPCPGLAGAIEEGMDAAERRRSLLRRFIEPLLARQVDTLVLGCTHYPLISDEIRDLAPSIRLIDTSDAIALQVVRQLEANHIVNRRGQPGSCRFFTSLGDSRDEESLTQLSRVFSYYWQEPVTVLAMEEPAGPE